MLLSPPPFILAYMTRAAVPKVLAGAVTLIRPFSSVRARSAQEVGGSGLLLEHLFVVDEPNPNNLGAEQDDAALAVLED